MYGTWEDIYDDVLYFVLANTDIAVSLPGMAPEAGVVKWTADGCAGITFNRLLPLATLIGWLQDRRDGMRRAG